MISAKTPMVRIWSCPPIEGVDLSRAETLVRTIRARVERTRAETRAVIVARDGVLTPYMYE